MFVCMSQAHYETCEFMTVTCEVCGQTVLKREVNVVTMLLTFFLKTKMLTATQPSAQANIH